ncbi:MAG: hypothetical protein CBARDMAM_7095 [uncultured Caballeronia sp.]|nr:MAG: hypothetical protein CBARDMAM_7095 [uncultured Caballeronia sp.]
MAVAQAVLGSGCAFAVSRGTFNYFSRDHGIPADLAEFIPVFCLTRGRSRSRSAS